MTMALVRRFLSNLIPQSFVLGTGPGAVTLRQRFNPFVHKLDVVVPRSAPFDRRLVVAMAVLIVAIEGDRWVGTMGCYVPDATTGPLLVGVYVSPDRRGEEAGVTLALLGEIERWASQRSDRLRLEVHEHNPRARRFYEKLGFEYTGHRRPYELEPGGLELEMEKRLR